MATQTAQKPPREGEAPAPAKLGPIPRQRAIQAAFVVGEMLNITLPDDQSVEEGAQDPHYWELIGPRLAMNQWLQITNDCGMFWRVMRVERLHASPGSGLRALVLRDVVPPKIVDVVNEPIVSTGEWYIRYLGPHRRWAIISPAGTVRREGIHSQAEAQTACHVERGNPPPI